MFPIVVLRAIVEWRMLKPALINFALLRRFHVFGFVQVPFVAWLLYVFGISQVAFGDIGTDSLFAGSTLRALACDATLDSVWEKVWQRSMLHWLPAPCLSVTVAISWLLSTVQMMWTLLWSIRRSDLQCATLHKVGYCGTSPSVMPFYCGNLNHDDVLFALADAGDLASLQCMLIPRYAYFLNRAQAKEQTTDTFILAELQWTKGFANTIVQRIFLSYILENCIQLNVQASLYAIVIASWRLRGVDEQLQVRALLSILIGIVASLLKLLDVYGFFSVVQTASIVAGRTDSNEEIRSLNADIQCRGWLATLGAFSLILSILYASAKMLMAHLCKDAVWNLNGCVDLRT